jgi:hypothetical protein
MKIKLIRTGGFIPVTKVSETEVNFSALELANLLVTIKHDTAAPKVKDGQYYELTVGSDSTSVDLEKVPEEYKNIFNKLKSDLKIIKQG